MHAEYTRTARPFTIGATYYFANPLGANGADPRGKSTIDNSLPGYAYSSLGELYAQYRTWRDFVQAGKMQIVTPWANPADARLVPVTFQGVFARSYVAPGWSVSLAHIARFKSRTSSTFDANNLLTSARTAGFTFVELANRSGRFNGSLDQYWFSDVASLTYAEARYDLSGSSFAGAQGVAEAQLGSALAGPVHNRSFGLQASTQIGALQVTLGYNGVLGSALLSPYTNGYVADPLYTTTMVASLVDQRTTGHATKIAVTGSTADGRITALASHTFYAFGEPHPGTATVTEADVMFLLSPIDPTRAYTGFSIRQRWGYRAGFGPPLHFLYSRTQVQYVF